MSDEDLTTAYMAGYEKTKDKYEAEIKRLNKALEIERRIKRENAGFQTKASDEYIQLLEAENKRLKELIEDLITAPDAQCFSEARARAQSQIQVNSGGTNEG